MINILLPAMGDSLFFKEYTFPKLMLEIDGETMMEKVVSNFSQIEDKRFIFVLSQKDCCEYHIDDSARIIAGKDSKIIVLKNPTGGALCTCMLAVKEIANDQPLIISNCDQVIDVPFQEVIDHFEKEGVDAGVITFPNIHPRWSYACFGGKSIVEVAEKRPISKNAIAGFYYFKRGNDFMEAAKKVILKEESFNGKYYISASLNEMILTNKKVGYYEISKEMYHSFYSPEKVKEYCGRERS